MSLQNDIQTLKGHIQSGALTAAQANVKMVQLEGVRLITSSVPRDVRTALNAAVKAGELGHIKKEGPRPEAYHHINARSRALALRNKEADTQAEALKRVFCIGSLTPNHP